MNYTKHTEHTQSESLRTVSVVHITAHTSINMKTCKHINTHTHISLKTLLQCLRLKRRCGFNISNKPETFNHNLDYTSKAKKMHAHTHTHTHRHWPPARRLTRGTKWFSRSDWLCWAAMFLSDSTALSRTTVSSTVAKLSNGGWKGKKILQDHGTTFSFINSWAYVDFGAQAQLLTLSAGKPIFPTTTESLTCEPGFSQPCGQFQRSYS